MIVLILIFIIEVIAALGKLEVFCKAGYKWWMGLIPIYSSWILITKVGKMASYWFVLDLIIVIISSLELQSEINILVTILDFFVTFCICFNIAKKFQKNPIFHGIIGGIFTGIWLMYLGIDKKTVYDDSVAVSSNGPFKL